jgi:hypothetical protein
MENNEVLDPAAAAAQLGALRADRAAIADRAMQPWWYDAALGLLIFGFVASYSISFPWGPIVALPVLCDGCAVLRAAYRRITGFWVDGMRPGRTRRAIHVWFAGYAVVLGLAAVAEFGLGWRGAMAVGGAVLGVGVALISRWWSRIYIAELRDQA